MQKRSIVSILGIMLLISSVVIIGCGPAIPCNQLGAADCNGRDDCDWIYIGEDGYCVDTTTTTYQGATTTTQPDASCTGPKPVDVILKCLNHSPCIWACNLLEDGITYAWRCICR